MAVLKADWHYPTRIRVGAGRVAELPALCLAQGMRAPLLVTDPGLAAQPMVQNAVAACRAAGLDCEPFSAIQGNPTGEQVMAGVTVFRAGRHDGVIGLGGGSALDAAKAVALMVGQARPLWDFEDAGDNWTRADAAAIPPLVAVPTTAGTGSEVGRAAVITDSEARVKRILFHPKLLPGAVILDPELTLALPPPLTAATGMDALSHSLEAYCAPGYHPLADGIALEGMRLVQCYLPRAVADGADLEARTQMLVASTMGATAFQKGLGGMHALAHSLGALYNAHHGLLNAILMPYVLVANREAIATPMTRLARYLALPEPGVEGVLAWVLGLREQLEIPHELGSIGIDTAEAERVGQMAAADPSAAGNPVPFDAARYRAIFRDAVQGRL